MTDGPPQPPPEPRDPDQPGWAAPEPTEPSPGPPPEATSGPPPEATSGPPPEATSGPPPEAAPPIPPPAAPPGTPPGPPPAWPPPGTAPAPPRRRKRSLLWLWILIPVLVAIAGLTVTTIVFGVQTVTAPIDTTNDFFRAWRDEQYGTAYDMTCASTRAATTRDEFETRLRRLGPLTHFDFTSSDFNNRGATTHGTIVLNGRERSVDVTLRKEDGEWRICDYFETRD